MNPQKKITHLWQQWHEQKIWHQNCYYRIRKQGPKEFECSILIPGPCGDTAYAPRIVVNLEQDLLKIKSYYNNHSTPIESLTEQNSSQEILIEKLESLLLKFEQAKKSTLESKF